jgi:nuclear pore complex protein Nup54
MQSGQTQGFKIGTGSGFGLGGQTQQSVGFGLGLGQTQGTGLQLGLGQQQQQQTGFKLGGLGTAQSGLTFGQQTGIGSTSLGGLGQKQSGFNLGLNQTKPMGLGLGGQTQTQTGGLQLGGGGFQLGVTGLGGQSSGLQLGKGFGLGQQSTGFNLGSGLTGTNSLLAQQQQQQQRQANELTVMAFALSRPNVFGDERNGIIAKFNQLQAYWGTGKGFASPNDVVTFTPDNPFCRFKAISYNRLPTAKDEDGLVGLEFKQPETELSGKSTAIQQIIHKVIGGKPELAVHVETIKGLANGNTEVVFYVSEVSVTGGSRRVLASRLYEALRSQTAQSQLTQNGVLTIYLKSGMTPAQVQAYLDSPPAGIDNFVWDTAKQENPDSNRLIPVPIIGLAELEQRIKQQEQETEQHQSRLKIIRNNVSQLHQRHTTMMAKLAQLRRKEQELQRRVLHVMVEQEVTRKQGFSVQPDEEQLRVQLDSIQTELNTPMQFKGRLNELMSQIRLQSLASSSGGSDTQFSLDPSVLQELRQHLTEQQKGLEHLKAIINEDLEDLSIIEQGLQER